MSAFPRAVNSASAASARSLLRSMRRWAIGICGVGLALTCAVLGRSELAPVSASLDAQATRASLAALVADEPALFQPVGDLSDCLADRGALRRLIVRVLPQWRFVKLQNVAHALRLWGPDAAFDDRRIPHRDGFHVHTPSGRELVEFLLNDQVYQKYAPPGAEPILFQTRYGIGVRYDPGLFEGQLAHVDKLLRICGELGLPRTAPVVTRQGGGQVLDLVTDSMARISEHQELEWTSEALARYLVANARWRNRFAEEWTVDRIARRLLRTPPGAGPCFGTHVCYALLMISRIDENRPTLSSGMRQRIRDYFLETSRSLERGQGADGSYPWRWAPNVEEPPRAQHGSSLSDTDVLAYEVAVTGHHLEWIGYAPADLRPPRQSILRAASYLLQALPRLSIDGQSNGYPPATHAVRALCLLANETPQQVLRDALNELKSGGG